MLQCKSVPHCKLTGSGTVIVKARGLALQCLLVVNETIETDAFALAAFEVSVNVGYGLDTCCCRIIGLGLIIILSTAFDNAVLKIPSHLH